MSSQQSGAASGQQVEEVAAEWTVTWQAPGERLEDWCNVHVGEDKTHFASVSEEDGAPVGGHERVWRAQVVDEGDNVSSGWRAEGVGPTEHVSDRPVRYEWATYFPRDYPDNTNVQFQVFTQWHQQDPAEDVTGTSPPVAFIVEEEKILLDLRYIDPEGDIGTSLVLEPKSEIAPLERDIWHYFRAEILWNLGSGWIKVWHSTTRPDFSGSPVERTGLMTIFPLRGPLQESKTLEPGTSYLKVGLYRGDEEKNPKFVVYHDEVRRLANPDDRLGCS
ncbi:MAG TPA: heparin lyase I family protein [Streptomyces sp.]|jgi:hypothetical protein|uniref:heparin lyase I family protein n=1 Tax=Streptomyces sp. TaxID=1931 RepID=UPI002B781C90|nr:heparin lyase I family protein [Streptomyces sp.]HWU08310.1 heparin lyase I family protein [Streptomyces sp.]HWU08315.1 heparin lyase I family protein [Streptomyces sp.]